MLINIAKYLHQHTSIYSLCLILFMSCGLYLLIKFYNFATRYNYVRWSLPGPKLDHPILGMNVAKLDGKFLANLENKLKDFPRFGRMLFGHIFSVFVTGPEVAQQVISLADSKNRTFNYMLEPWLGNGLILSNGSFWKRNRKLLTPTFHYQSIRNFVKIINTSCDKLVQVINRDRNGKDAIEFDTRIHNTTLEVILNFLSSKGLDLQLNINKNCSEMKYVKGLEKIRQGISARFSSILNTINFIFLNRQVGKEFIKGAEMTKHYFRSLIQERQEIIKEEQDSEDTDSTKSNYDMLDLLMRSRDEEGNGLTQKQIIDELNTFVFAGHDTTGSTSSFVFYLLAKYPQLQEKCREEVMTVMEGRDEIEWEDIAKFTYLTCFIKETLRLYPPALFVSKMVDKPLVIDGYHIPANVNLDIWTYLIHRNPNYWPEPNKFDPSRFNEENIAKQHPFAYIPFSAGSRSCFGQIFAMSELKIITAKLVKNFQISLMDGYEMNPMVKVVLSPSDNLPLIFKPL